MGVNSLSFEQSASLLNALRAEATGTNATSQIINSKDFVSVATTTLAQGYDPVLNALTIGERKLLIVFPCHIGQLQLAGNITPTLGVYLNQRELASIASVAENRPADELSQSVKDGVITLGQGGGGYRYKVFTVDNM